MKKLLMVSNGERLATRTIKATLMLLISLSLGIGFWLAMTPVANAQDMSPTRMLESQMPQGKTMANVSKQEYLAAVCAAVKKFRNAAPQIVRVAVEAHQEWSKDILRTAFRCLGTGDCRLLNRVLRAAIVGGDASELTNLAIELAPDCASAFGGAAEDEGNFGNAPGNQNPPPGTIGAGGGQGNVVAICHNGHTIFVSPQGAENHLRNHPGDRLGPCPVTQSRNN
ncbi:MAG: hypothetical protein M3Z22_01360 [Verrucomicrobiota bacterium]|nr:hypothetical protein [Verrucomicrobiota bacterium]